MKRIDPHVHCRDGVEIRKANIRKVSELAMAQGIVHICDMPSINFPILTENDVVGRLDLARRRKPVTGYSVFMTLTLKEEQIKEAVRVAQKYHEVAGLKLWPPENEKRIIYKTLARLGYTGVLAVHAEKASLFKPELFNPKEPWTHNLVRPPEAEIASIKEQIRFAEEANFRGTLYICHITLPESAEITWQAKKYLNIYSEVTPHHLLLSTLQMRGKNGLLLKVNPPLRSREAVGGLLRVVRQGKVDCLGTDYSPHLSIEKLLPPYLSGIAYYQLYGMALDYLAGQGLPEKDIENMTYWNIKKVFGEKLKNV